MADDDPKDSSSRGGDDPKYSIPIADGSTTAAPMPLSVEVATGEFDDLYGPQSKATPATRVSRAAAVIQEAKPGDAQMVAQLLAGKLCRACRYFDKEAGQRKFARERLETTLMTELLWKAGWHDPTKVGLCHIDPRTATHEDASCEFFRSKNAIFSTRIKTAK